MTLAERYPHVVIALIALTLIAVFGGAIIDCYHAIGCMW